MALKLDNNHNLPGMRGGNYGSAQLPNGVAVAAGYTLYPGEAAYWADGAGKSVRPPLANLALIAFSVAPSSGDVLTATVNGETVTQNWDTDAATTMAALKVKLEAIDGVASATVQNSNKDIALVADAGAECIVTAVANSDGTTTDTVTHDTSDTFAFVVTRENAQPIDGVHKFTEKMLVTGVQRGDSVSCYVGGGESDTYDINASVLVRLVANGTNRPGQIMCGDDSNPGESTTEARLSFSGEGEAGDYEYIYVKEQ